MQRIFFYLFLGLLTIASSACGVAKQSINVDAVAVDGKIQGLCWVGSDSIVKSNFEEAGAIGAEWVSLTAFGEMEAYNKPNISPKQHQDWWGDTDMGIAHTARVAHAAGKKVMLKPHLTMPRGEGYWRHDIKMTSKDNWDQWFANYEAWILGYAKMAASANVEMLCIGTELYQTTTKYPEKWSTIIKAIRKVYQGDLIYAANWYKELEQITFWKELDYIGVQAYFPLGNKLEPNTNYLKRKWKKHKRDVNEVATKYNRKVIFTEMGYKNTKDANKKPWEWPQDIGGVAQRSDRTQQHCYQAFFESFWNEPWVAGVFVWNWHHPTYKIDNMEDYFSDRERRMKLWSSQIGKPINPQIYFSPQQRPAFKVLRKWFLN